MADPNRALFESVVTLLAPVLDALVFVGGCTTGIFVTDPAAVGIRPTRDVDAIVLEDIVTVVDARPEILDDVARADEQVRAYISAEMRSLLDNRDFMEALAGLLLPDAASQARRPILEQRLRVLAR